MTALDLSVQAGFLAVLLGFVVLLSLFEESVRGVVVRRILYVFGRNHGFRRGAICGRCPVSVSGVELLDELVVGLGAVLPLGVILCCGVLGAVVKGRQYYRDTRGYCYYVDQNGRPIYDYNTRC